MIFRKKWTKKQHSRERSEKLRQIKYTNDKKQSKRKKSNDIPDKLEYKDENFTGK